MITRLTALDRPLIASLTGHSTSRNDNTSSPIRCSVRCRPIRSGGSVVARRAIWTWISKRRKRRLSGSGVVNPNPRARERVGVEPKPEPEEPDLERQEDRETREGSSRSRERGSGWGRKGGRRCCRVREASSRITRWPGTVNCSCESIQRVGVRRPRTATDNGRYAGLEGLFV